MLLNPGTKIKPSNYRGYALINPLVDYGTR
jgi:hypothetical protein